MGLSHKTRDLKQGREMGGRGGLSLQFKGLRQYFLIFCSKVHQLFGPILVISQLM